MVMSKLDGSEFSLKPLKKMIVKSGNIFQNEVGINILC